MECSWARSQPGESAEATEAELWRLRSMENPARHILWPGWATWALIAVVVTSLVTIAATINDIW